MAYKYNGIQPNPEQVGMLITEDITSSAVNTIDTTYEIATKTIYEHWNHDINGSYYSGVTALVNTSRNPDLNIFGNITSVSGNTINVSNGIQSGEVITVSYYAIGTDVGSSTQCPDPSKTAGNSVIALPGTFISHFSLLNIKSTRNLPQLGYKWADMIATKTIAGDDISGVTYDTEFIYDINDSSSNDLDYGKEVDGTFPIVLEEIRFITDNTSVRVRPDIKLGDRTTYGYFKEGGNTYIDISTSSATYKTNDASIYICSLPLLGIASDYVEVKMFSTGIGAGDSIKVELCGWYKPALGE